MSDELDPIIDEIIEEDPRYAKGAYYLVREGLEHTVKNLSAPSSDSQIQHVSGQQLLEGIREYTLIQYGPMSKKLLESWSIHNCEDFGHIVFNLVNRGVFGKNDQDSIEDFKDAYDFYEAFEAPFLPKPNDT